MVKHFLHISDYSNDELWEILHLAKEVKTKFHNREEYKPFKDQSLAMILPIVCTDSGHGLPRFPSEILLLLLQ